MSTIIYTDFAQSTFSDTATEQSIEEIIASIRDGRYAGIIDRIRNTKVDAERKKLKRSSLPVFYPTVRVSQGTRLSEDSVPTGIVQFDIDTKTNDELDFNALRIVAIRHPACMYAFSSPSGGLKIGILTDFVRPVGEAIETTKRRFKLAYGVCLHNIQQHCRTLFDDDIAVSQIRQSCYLSHDPYAFFRADCTPLKVNALCDVPLQPPTSATFVEVAAVEVVLDHIPRILPYDARTKVNLCVLHMLGRAGIALLKKHWQKEEQFELAQQLEECLRGAKFGSIDLLQSYAEEYGPYKRSKAGWDRRRIEPEPCSHRLPALVTSVEGTAMLQSIVRDFVTGKESHFVNVTAGAGKTHTVLEALSREVGTSAKILFLVPRHDLAQQIIETYREIRDADIAAADTLRGKLQRPSITRLRARVDLCENEEARTTLEENGVSIPLKYCLTHCVYQGSCQYTQQFNSLTNIRVMDHNQWKNEQSAWFNGSRLTDKGGIEPNDKSSPWTPDYIVIDEDILKLGETQEEHSSPRFPSVGLIISSVHSGQDLRDAVWTHREQVLADATTNQKPEKPSPALTPTEYLAAAKRIKAGNRRSEILARLEHYCQSDDATYLTGMWIAEKAIRWLPLPAVAERYEGIPTLYLDATAHPAVVDRLLPNVQFHRIAVRQSENVRLFQLSNMTITKKWLNEPANLPVLAKGLTEILKSKCYKNVGLITYKQIGQDKQFPQTLAKKIGATSWGHFANVRGLNTMKDVDCLLIVGRHFLPSNTTCDYTRAIFDIDADWKTVYADQPVRMKDGRTFRLNTQILVNPWHQVIYEQTSLAETLQAIGRGRLVHGPEKDVYVFSNENLTVNTEVDEFFTFERYFERPTAPPRAPANLVTADALEKVRDRGFVHLKPTDLTKQLSLTQNQVRSTEKQKQIAKELMANGAMRIDVKVRFDKSNTVRRIYLVFDMQKLEKALEDKRERLIE